MSETPKRTGWLDPEAERLAARLSCRRDVRNGSHRLVSMSVALAEEVGPALDIGCEPVAQGAGGGKDDLPPLLPKSRTGWVDPAKDRAAALAAIESGRVIAGLRSTTRRRLRLCRRVSNLVQGLQQTPCAAAQAGAILPVEIPPDQATSLRARVSALLGRLFGLGGS